jgi:16S rRNA (uracil1498-N3)-methyltransferase
MEYFFTPPHLIGRHELTVEGDEFAHLTHVMRKKPGDSIRVVNGAGTAYDAIIIDNGGHTARCEITATHQRLNEPEVDLTLGVAILKNSSKFDFLVEKATELGVTVIVPLITERSIPHHAKTNRWQKLALAAMKQSGRCVLPLVHETSQFENFISTPHPGSLQIIPHEKAEEGLKVVLASRSHLRVVMCIGPEGGFSDVEIDSACGRGFRPVSLGPTRLRTETAAIVSVAAVVMPD